MRVETETVAAIDVGTTKVCTIVGRKSRTRGVDVLGHSTVPCDGLQKGNVVDIAATEKAVRESIKIAEGKTGQRIESACVGVTGAHIGFENRRDSLASVGEHGVITAQDLNGTTEVLARSNGDPRRRIIHSIRTSYSLDGEAGIRNPLGMHTSQVEVETHLVTGGMPFISKLVQAVEQAGARVSALVLEPLASGMAILTPQEKERGVVLLDMGGGTTDVVAFRQGRIFYTGVIPVGGYQFTNDIALTFNTNYAAAEAVKLKHASTEMQMAGANEEIMLPVVGQRTELRVQRMDICQLTRERAQELTRLVKFKLDEAQIAEPSSMRVVVTGGASNLPGLVSLMQRGLAMPVRHGVPDVQGTLPDELKDSAHATSVGILLWALSEYVPARGGNHRPQIQSGERGPTGLLSGLVRQLSKLMPATIFATRKGRT